MISPCCAFASGSTTSLNVYGLTGAGTNTPVACRLALGLTTVWSLRWRGFDWRTTYSETWFSSSGARYRRVGSACANMEGFGGGRYLNLASERGMFAYSMAAEVSLSLADAEDAVRYFSAAAGTPAPPLLFPQLTGHSNSNTFPVGCAIQQE